MLVVDAIPPQTMLESFLTKAGEAHQRGDRSLAIKLYSRALIIDPDSVGALNNLAILLAESGNWSVAKAYAWRGAIQCDEGTLPWANLAAMMVRTEEYDAARAIFERMVLNHPNDMPRLWQDLAQSCMPSDQPRALQCFSHAVRLAPNDPIFRQNFALQQLTMHDWDAGFANWRNSGIDTTVDPNFVTCPEWRGESLEGRTIVIYHEQGFGDTIQFCRFLRLLDAKRVILAVPSPLVRLLETSGIADTVVDFADPLPPDVDCQCPLMFAWAYRSIVPSLAERQTVPYLKVPERGPRVHRAENTLLMVGICWAGNPIYGTDELRSMQLNHLLPLTSIPGVQFVSLQKGLRAGDVSSLGADLLIRDLSGQIGDLADVAYVIDKMDLVASVDTAALHLAGALGKPTIAMLPYNRCWRWGRGTDETPFYPTMKLVTQPKPKDWGSVVNEVHRTITEMIGDRRIPPEPQTNYERLEVPFRIEAR